MERLLQPHDPCCRDCRQPLGAARDILTPDLAGIGQQDPVRAQPCASSKKLIGIGGQAATPERSPAELQRPRPAGTAALARSSVC